MKRGWKIKSEKGVKNKKGVSVVIGSLLMVVITIAIAATVYSWSTAFTSERLTTKDFNSTELLLEAYTLNGSNLRLYVRNTSPGTATLDAVYVNNDLIVQNLHQGLPPYEVTTVDLGTVTTYPFARGDKVKLATKEGQWIVFWIKKIS